MKEEFNRHGEMLDVLLRYTQSLIGISRGARRAASPRHTERLARAQAMA